MSNSRRGQKNTQSANNQQAVVVGDQAQAPPLEDLQTVDTVESATTEQPNNSGGNGNSKPQPRSREAIIAAKRAKRAERTKLHGRDVLVAPKREGFVRRYVNIDDGYKSIKRMLEKQWDIVHDPYAKTADAKAGLASQIGSAVQRPVGGGLSAILMEIEKELYDEDQQAKVEHNREIERSMMRPRTSTDNKDMQYSEGAQVKIG